MFESTLFAKLCEFLGCERVLTTAYHPAAKGVVERLHRQLKAGLMSHAAREHLGDNLPIVLLGTRSSLKPDVNACAAEHVNWSTIRLPGEFLEETTRPAPGDVNDLLHRIRQFVRSQQPKPTRLSSASSFLDSYLKTCSHVFLRCDRVRRPLQPPYNGPCQLLSQFYKTFKPPPPP